MGFMLVFVGVVMLAVSHTKTWGWDKGVIKTGCGLLIIGAILITAEVMHK